jgi:hypothetical protein
MTKLHAFVARGPGKGTQLFPHRHEDGAFVVSSTKFERDYVRVTDEADLLALLEAGLKLRMSNPADGASAPRLISPDRIFRPVVIKP